MNCSVPTNNGQIIGSIQGNQTNNFYYETSSQQREIYHQLFRLANNSTDGSYEWYKDRIEERVEGTCNWLLDQAAFKDWTRRDSGLLMITADPGCGKSVLAKYLIDDKLPELSSATICYFFFKDQDQNTLNQATCALLHQLFSHKPLLIRHAMPEYSKNGPDLVNITSSLWNVLVAAGRDPEAGPVIFILDALDECRGSDLRNLLQRLKNQFTQNGGFGMVRFIATSRPYSHIMSEYRGVADAFPCIHIPGEEESDAISEEINHVIRHRVNQLGKKRELRSEIKCHLENRLLTNPHRTYLWVYLVFDYLETQDFKRTKKGIEFPIDTLPNSVNQVYENILSKSKYRDIVRKALCIILGACRPLTVGEMNMAMNVNSTSDSLENLDLEDDEDFEKSLRNWCGLFISIYDHQVYFLHQTAREFLLKKNISLGHDSVTKWAGSMSDQEAHSVLALICIVYLNAAGVINNSKLLHYSAANWVFHFNHADVGTQEKLDYMALEICDPATKKYLYWIDIYRQATHCTYYPRFIHCICLVSCIGLTRIVKQFLDSGKVNVNSKEGDGSTSLSLAAAYGHDMIVKLLLDSDGVDVNSKTKIGWTPLFYATKDNHDKIVKLLLNSDKIDVNSKDNYGWTPLFYDNHYECDEIVKLLLGLNRVNVNSKDNHGWTPLFYAAKDNHDKIVKLLLSSDKIDVNIRDNNGWTPLCYAIHHGRDEIVKLLLGFHLVRR
ncbi:hypothetical protein McanMca71_007477 [Microsporum canis]